MRNTAFVLWIMFYWPCLASVDYFEFIVTGDKKFIDFEPFTMFFIWLFYILVGISFSGSDK